MSTGKARGKRMAALVSVLVAMLAPPVPASATATTQCHSGNDTVSLTLTIEGIRNSKGTISIAVYGDRPEDFLAKGKKLRKLRLVAQSGTVRGCLSLPRPGTYAFTAYHDEDGDRHFTRNFLGLPTEGFAVSNNPTTVLGPPAFQDSAVSINENNSQVIMKMHYP